MEQSDLIPFGVFKKWMRERGIKLPQLVKVGPNTINVLRWKNIPELVAVDGKKTSDAPMFAYRVDYNTWKDSSGKYHYNKPFVSYIHWVGIKSDLTHDTIIRYQEIMNDTANSKESRQNARCYVRQYNWMIQSTIRRYTLDKRLLYYQEGMPNANVRSSRNVYLKDKELERPTFSSLQTAYKEMLCTFTFFQKLLSSDRAVNYRQQLQVIKQQRRDTAKAFAELNTRSWSSEGPVKAALNIARVIAQDTI